MGKPGRGVLGARAPLLFLGLAFSLTLLLTRSYVVQSDEGYTLNAAWQMWNGMKMYDDFRLFVGPGSAYSVYGLWHLIGAPSYLAARFLSLVFSFSATTALYLTLRSLGIRGGTLAFSVLAWLTASSLLVALNHNSFSSFAAIWFLLLFLRIARASNEALPPRHQIRDHVWLGVAAGIVGLFLQTKGFFLAAGAIAFTFCVGFKRRDFRPALAVAGGFVVVLAPLFVIWSPAVLIRQWFVIPLTGNYLGHTGASGAIALCALALTGSMAWIAWRRRDRVLQALAVTQAALVACMSHNLELGHLAINCFPAIVFAAVLVHERLARHDGRASLSPELTLAIVLALFGATIVWLPAGAAYAASSSFYVDILGRRSRPEFFSSPRIAAAHAIYAGPFLPGLYFELEKKNPFFVSETVVCDNGCQQRLIGELSAIKPELVFLYYPMIRHLSYDQNNPVDVYLRDRYTLCPGDDYGGMIVRASDPGWCP